MILVPVGRLEGGHSSEEIELFDAEFEDGSVRRVVRKWTTGHEVRALLALREVGLKAGAVSELLDYGRDGDRGAWVLLPYYEGTQPERIPGEVFEGLAAVHAHYRSGVPQGIVVIDAEWWREMCENVTAPVLERCGFGDAAREVALGAGHGGVWAALERLPRTFLHGDMHAGNVISGPGGATIIDWGNARIGPQLLDVVNVAQEGDEGEAAYLAEWSRLAGRALGAEEVAIGRALGNAIVNTQYLGFVAEHRTAGDVATMVERRREALGRLCG